MITDPDPPHYIGHRKRLRQKFLRTQESCADYELLELLLFGVILRGDTKPLAKQLIQIFGSLRDVLEATPDALSKVSGMGPSSVVMIKLCHTLGLVLLKDKVYQQPVLSGWRQVVDYCSATMSHLKNEQLRILFLDHKNNLIVDEILQEGTVSQIPIYPRNIAKRALEVNASNIILVHNHPTGDPTPSQADIAITKKIYDLLKRLDIHVLDHLILGKGRHVSLRTEGLL